MSRLPLAQQVGLSGMPKLKSKMAPPDRRLYEMLYVTSGTGERVKIGRRGYLEPVSICVYVNLNQVQN